HPYPLSLHDALPISSSTASTMACTCRSVVPELTTNTSVRTSRSDTSRAITSRAFRSVAARAATTASSRERSSAVTGLLVSVQSSLLKRQSTRRCSGECTGQGQRIVGAEQITGGHPPHQQPQHHAGQHQHEPVQQLQQPWGPPVLRRSCLRVGPVLL